MRVKFWCNSGANIHSKREEIFDTKDLGYTDEEWNSLSEESKNKEVETWAWEKLEMGFEEI